MQLRLFCLSSVVLGGLSKPRNVADRDAGWQGIGLFYDYGPVANAPVTPLAGQIVLERSKDLHVMVRRSADARGCLSLSIGEPSNQVARACIPRQLRLGLGAYLSQNTLNHMIIALAGKDMRLLGCISDEGETATETDCVSSLITWGVSRPLEPCKLLLGGLVTDDPVLPVTVEESFDWRFIHHSWGWEVDTDTNAQCVVQLIGPNGAVLEQVVVGRSIERQRMAYNWKKSARSNGSVQKITNNFIFVVPEDVPRPSELVVQASLLEAPSFERVVNGSVSNLVFLVLIRPDDADTDGSLVTCLHDGQIELFASLMPRIGANLPELGCARFCRAQNVCIDPREPGWSKHLEPRHLFLQYGRRLAQSDDVWWMPLPRLGMCSQSQVWSGGQLLPVVITASELHGIDDVERVRGTTVWHRKTCHSNLWHSLAEDFSALFHTLLHIDDDVAEWVGGSNASVIFDTAECDAPTPSDLLYDALATHAKVRMWNMRDRRSMICFDELVLGSHINRMVVRSYTSDNGGYMRPNNRHATRWTQRDGDAFRSLLLRALGGVSHQGAVCSAFNEAAGSRIELGFIVRSSKRVIVNLPQLREIARYVDTALSWSDLEFDSMPLDQQVVRLQSLHILAGTYGAGLTHTIVLCPGAIVIEIIAENMPSYFSPYRFLSDYITRVLKHIQLQIAETVIEDDQVENQDEGLQNYASGVFYMNDWQASEVMLSSFAFHAKWHVDTSRFKAALATAVGLLRAA